MLDVIRKILNTPTAPMRENLVLEQVTKICKDNKIPNYTDNYGNLFVGAGSERELAEKSFLLPVHADHPGGIVLRKNGSKYLCKWLGGYPKSLDGQDLIIFDTRSGETFKGRCLVEEFIGGFHFFILDVPLDIQESELGHFGVCLDFEATVHGDTVLCRAADNLASVSLICAWLNTKKDLELVFVFTKCEEENRSGSRGIAKRLENFYKGNVLSVDVMEKVPGVGLGSGLVIKHGDAVTTFSKTLVDFILTVCKKFKYTEVNISKGKNEASVFVKKGFKAASVGFAVENYHNSSVFVVKARPEEFLIPDGLEVLQFLDHLNGGIQTAKLKKSS